MIREQLRLAERAAAAPYVDYPKDPWWHSGLISLVGPLFALLIYTVQAGLESVIFWSALSSFAITGIVLFITLTQRKRRGALPPGRKAPLELRPVYRWYFIGATIVVMIIIAVALLTSLWISLPVSFGLALGGVLWFRFAHNSSAAEIRKRLA